MVSSSSSSPASLVAFAPKQECRDPGLKQSVLGECATKQSKYVGWKGLLSFTANLRQLATTFLGPHLPPVPSVFLPAGGVSAMISEVECTVTTTRTSSFWPADLRSNCMQHHAGQQAQHNTITIGRSRVTQQVHERISSDFTVACPICQSNQHKVAGNVGNFPSTRTDSCNQIPFCMRHFAPYAMPLLMKGIFPCKAT